MGVCISRDDQPSSTHKPDILESPPARSLTRNGLPSIGGRRLANHVQRSQEEFSDALQLQLLANVTPSAPQVSLIGETPPRGFIRVRPSTIDSYRHCSPNQAAALPAPLATDCAEPLSLQVGLEGSATVLSSPSSEEGGLRGIPLVASGDDFTGSSSATRPARMSSSSRRFLRSPRTVSFSSSVLTFTEIPSAPPPSPASAPLPLTESVVGWDSLQAELRSVAVRQLEEMLIGAERNGEPLSEEILNSLFELPSEIEQLAPVTSLCAQRTSTPCFGARVNTPFAKGDAQQQQQQQTGTADGQSLLCVNGAFDVSVLVDENVHAATGAKRRPQSPVERRPQSPTGRQTAILQALTVGELQLPHAS